MSRAYANAVAWIKEGRPRRIDRAHFARRALWGNFVAGMGLMSAIALLRPEGFGLPGREPSRTGWPGITLMVVIAAVIVYAVVRQHHLRWLWDRVREPFRRPLSESRYYEGAVTSLDACSEVLQARFGIAWVWFPAVVWVAGAAFAFSTAFFVIDAVMARGGIGWGQPALAAGNALASFVTFAAVGGRLSTWRLAASVHKAVTTGWA